MRKIHLLLGGVGGAALAIAVGASASADCLPEGCLTLSPDHGPPGTQVDGGTGIRCVDESTTLDLYLYQGEGPLATPPPQSPSTPARAQGQALGMTMQFTIPQLPPGEYQLAISCPAYTNEEGEVPAGVYPLSPDTLTITAIPETATEPPGPRRPVTQIFWTDANWWGTARAEVGAANADGTDVRTLVPATAGPEGVQQAGYVAIDPGRGLVYWAEDYPSPGISRVRADGRAEDWVIGQGRPFGVAIARGHVYWTDIGDETIKRSRRDGTGITTLVRGLGVPGSFIASPHDLAIDEAGEMMYWTNTAQGLVQRARLDGTHVETIATMRGPIGIGLDPRGGQVYFTNGGCIYRVSTGGGPTAMVVCATTAMTDVAVDPASGDLYWTEEDDRAEAGSIWRARMDGSGREVVVDGLAYPWGIAVGQVTTLPPPVPDTSTTADRGGGPAATRGLTAILLLGAIPAALAALALRGWKRRA